VALCNFSVPLGGAEKPATDRDEVGEKVRELECLISLWGNSMQTETARRKHMFWHGRNCSEIF